LADCGNTLTAETEDMLVKDLQKRAKDKRGRTMPENKVKEAVKQGHT
jgi:hypothetical protein